jgi:tRNA-splicing ligase RtcB (3'-phosphate/5'-hydroxy nucleic acid ligase)
MGDAAVILEGMDSPEARASLYSTVHGASLFGRKEAKRRLTRQEMDRWLTDRRVTADGRAPGREPDGLPPHLPEVLAQHAGAARAAHAAAVCCGDGGGENEFNSFKNA